MCDKISMMIAAKGVNPSLKPLSNLNTVIAKSDSQGSSRTLQTGTQPITASERLRHPAFLGESNRILPRRIMTY
jgi:hypothetical protein